MIDIEHDSGKPVGTTVAQVMYILHALAPFTFWSLALLAIVIGWMHRGNVRGTWLETHYAWLSSTFWRGIGWVIVLTIVFVLSVVGILFLVPLWFILTVWYLWRVIKGWLRLNEAKPIPA